ncbi:MAG TPA: hypothetical protein VIF60_24050 [Burkholderiaceae bacterium]
MPFSDMRLNALIFSQTNMGCVNAGSAGEAPPSVSDAIVVPDARPAIRSENKIRRFRIMVAMCIFRVSLSNQFAVFHMICPRLAKRECFWNRRQGAWVVALFSLTQPVGVRRFMAMRHGRKSV